MKTNKTKNICYSCKHYFADLHSCSFFANDLESAFRDDCNGEFYNAPICFSPVWQEEQELNRHYVISPEEVFAWQEELNNRKDIKTNDKSQKIKSKEGKINTSGPLNDLPEYREAYDFIKRVFCNDNEYEKK